MGIINCILLMSYSPTWLKLIWIYTVFSTKQTFALASWMRIQEDSGVWKNDPNTAFSNTFHKKIYIYIYIYLSKMQLHISETTKCIPLNRFWGIQFSTKGQLLFTKGLNSTGLQALIVWRLTIVTNGKEGKTRHKSVPWILIEMYSKV